VEVAGSSPPVTNPPDLHAIESQPLQTKSLTQKADGAPLVALEPDPSTANNPQRIPASSGESDSESPGIAQLEPLADYSGNRLEPQGIVSVPHAEPAGAAPKGSATPSPPSNERGSRSLVRTLGYVEKTGREKEAIVEVFDQVYLVHEGELFAEKYRALRVTPTSVEIVEESREGLGLPPPNERQWYGIGHHGLGGETTINCAFFLGNVICLTKECQTPHFPLACLGASFHSRS